MSIIKWFFWTTNFHTTSHHLPCGASVVPTASTAESVLWSLCFPADILGELVAIGTHFAVTSAVAGISMPLVAGGTPSLPNPGANVVVAIHMINKYMRKNGLYVDLKTVF